MLLSWYASKYPIGQTPSRMTSKQLCKVIQDWAIYDEPIGWKTTLSAGHTLMSCVGFESIL